MSEDFYLVCKKHRQVVSISTHGMSGYGLFNDGQSLAAFSITHSGCDLVVMKDQDFWDLEESQFEPFVEWDDSNHADLYLTEQKN